MRCSRSRTWWWLGIARANSPARRSRHWQARPCSIWRGYSIHRPRARTTWDSTGRLVLGETLRGAHRLGAAPGPDAKKAVVVRHDEVGAEQQADVAYNQQPRRRRAAFLAEAAAVDHHTAHQGGGDGDDEHDEQNSDGTGCLAREDAEDQHDAG